MTAVREAARPGRRNHQPRRVDFARPTKFTADQQRRITRATETFCQTANTRLSTELRSPLELEILSTAQLTWAAALGQLPGGSLMTVVELDPIGTRMLLTVEQPFVGQCLECLLGGTPDQPGRERRLTEIDWSLTRRLVDSIVHPLSLVWQELAGVSLRVGEIEGHDAGQIASVSEPTFTMLLEARINGHSFTLALLIPWVAIEPVIGAIAGQHDNGDAGTDELPPIHRPLSDVAVTLRAEVACTEMRVQDILALRPGSVISFTARAEEGVGLLAEHVELARVKPGARGLRRAVQIPGDGGRR